jgi:hypothetical protein
VNALLPVRADCPFHDCGRSVWRDEARLLTATSLKAKCSNGHRVRAWIRPDGTSGGWEPDRSPLESLG